MTLWLVVLGQDDTDRFTHMADHDDRPPLIEAAVTADIFASEVVAVDPIEGTDCVRVTFATTQGGSANVPKERHIVAKLVMPAKVFAALASAAGTSAIDQITVVGNLISSMVN